MPVRIVIMRVRLNHLRITAIEHHRRIVAVMAVVVIRHVGIHIRLIMVEVDGFGALVVAGPVVVIIRRVPSHVRRFAEYIPQRRTFDEYRTNDIVGSVEPAVTYHLHIQCAGTVLRDERSYILIDRWRQASLNEEGMVHASMGLNYAEVVNPSVTIEVEVVNHIPAGVEQLFELSYRTRLCESCSHRVEVEIEREVGIVTGDGDGSYRSMFRRRSCHLRRINGLHRHNDFRRRRYRPDTCPAACQTDSRYN